MASTTEPTVKSNLPNPETQAKTRSEHSHTHKSIPVKKQLSSTPNSPSTETCTPNSPLTETSASKQVRTAFNFIQACHNGFQIESRTTLKLTPEDKDILWSLLEKNNLLNFLVYKLRWDWSPQDFSFTIKMETLLHAKFTGQLMEIITTQLKSFTHEDANISSFVNQLVQTYSAKIPLPHISPSPDRLPDHSLGRVIDQYPTLILETAYSQPGRKFDKTAYHYIAGSKGNIRLVIGCDIEYASDSSKATISLWESNCVPNPCDQSRELIRSTKILDNDLFRAHDGTCVRNRVLRLQFRHLAPIDELARIPLIKQGIVVVTIPYETLFNILNAVEMEHETKQEGRGKQAPFHANRDIEKWDSPSPEKLTPTRERKFAMLEAEDEEKGKSKDSSWSNKKQR